MSQKMPPGQQAVARWPVRTAEQMPKDTTPEHWTLKISGLVDEEVILSWVQIQALKVVELKRDFHCVETWSVMDNIWKGVLVRDVLAKVAIKPQANFAMIHSWGGYTSDIDLNALMADDTMLAWERNGKPIPPEHGYPLRLIVPDRYAYKSVKWVVEIELMQGDRPGYWEERGYHRRADVWKAERFQD